MGLPGSGKTTLAEKLVEELKAVGRNVEWFNADKIRELYNDWDFSEEGRFRQAERMANFANTAEKQGKIVVADFVCPTHKLRSVFDPDIVVWMDTIIAGRFEDTNKIFEEPISYDYHVTEFDAFPWAKVIADNFRLHNEA